jgi:hypothetical protein
MADLNSGTQDQPGVNEVVKYFDLDEFKNEGWLQEANRLFFHPRGLALTVDFENGHVTGFTGIWDYRDDPEGVLFGPDQFGPEDQAKADAIEAIRKRKVEARFRLGCLGDGIQPIVPPSPAPAKPWWE